MDRDTLQRGIARYPNREFFVFGTWGNGGIEDFSTWTEDDWMGMVAICEPFESGDTTMRADYAEAIGLDQQFPEFGTTLRVALESVFGPVTVTPGSIGPRPW